MLVIASRDPVGNETAALPNYRVMAPYGLIDDNGNRQGVRYDALGVPVATAIMGKPGEQVGDWFDLDFAEAQPDEHPTTKASYDLYAWQAAKQPTWVQIEARETHYFSEGGDKTRWLLSRTYYDGSGRAAMTKALVAPGPAPVLLGDGGYAVDPNSDDGGGLLLKHSATRYVGTGRVVVDNKGNPVKQYEPFFTPTLAWDSDQQLASLGVTPILRYDPLGRLVRVDLPDGSFRRTTWSPWRQTVWDQNDTVLDSAWYAARMRLTDGTPEKKAATQTAQLAGTPTSELLDSQGRVVRKIELLRATDEDGVGKLTSSGEPEITALETQIVRDVEGNQLVVIDPRGVEVQRDVFDLSGSPLLSRNPDAGPVWLLEDAGAQPLLRADGRGVITTFAYDALRRPTAVRVRTEPGAPWQVVEATIYGEAVPDAAARNLRGEVALSFDEAGLEEAGGFDSTGNLLSQRRQLRA